MNSDQPTPARDVLTQEEAKERARRISQIKYEIHLDLVEGASTYRGDVTIRFEHTAKEQDYELFLDHRGGSIEQVKCNGETLQHQADQDRITLPNNLLPGQNIVRVIYEHEYDHTGDGLHQFVDPEDGSEYLYTNFEPYNAHRLFPCFDQPDLKATYELAVDAPANWELIANSTETNREPLDNGRLRRHFATTEPFSTYLFALIAGPYHAVRDEHRGIPLGFFCRRSLVEHLDEDELFEITKQGLDFYAEFFDYDYPFGKYDQVFVPEFNAGAMENVGAVTHSERMVFRDPPTDNQRLGRAEVLLHEMAHMWFGNLVTMRWWNDLWLNESFATYMAYLSMVEATRFTSAWQAFNSGMKAWAYRQDQLITTHPIAGQVHDTDETFLNFDGITYGKGASVLKQLVAAVGMDSFREGMRIYFRRHAFDNTTLAEFLDAIGQGAGHDIHDWAKLWLETASLNTIAAKWELEDGRLTHLSIAQTAPEDYSTLRPHQLDIALVGDGESDGDGYGVATIETLSVAIEGSETVIEDASRHLAPQLVMPNHNDHAFVKVALDDRSLNYVNKHLERVADPLLRQLIWQSLWNMVRDQQLSSTDYLPLTAAKIPTESDTELMETILATVTATIARYVPTAQREEQAHRFSEVAWNVLNQVPTGDRQIIWARTLIGIAITPPDLDRVIHLVDNDISVSGLKIDQEMRWGITTRAIAHGVEGATERVSLELERDPSDRGERSRIRAEVAEPSEQVKASAWDRIHGEGYGSLHLTAAAMGGFHWFVQRDLLDQWVWEFFERVPTIFHERPNEFARAYFANLFPHHLAEQSVLQRSQTLLAEIKDSLPLLARSLREANDDLERAILCKALAAS